MHISEMPKPAKPTLPKAHRHTPRSKAVFSRWLHHGPLLPQSHPEWPHAKLLPAVLSSLSTPNSRHHPVAEASSQWLAHLIPPAASRRCSALIYARSLSAATYPSSSLAVYSLCSLLFPPHSLHPSNAPTQHQPVRQELAVLAPKQPAH